jgi:hypothetical protein
MVTKYKPGILMLTLCVAAPFDHAYVRAGGATSVTLEPGQIPGFSGVMEE